MVLTEMVQLSVDTLIVLNSLLTVHECGPFPASSCTWVGPAPPWSLVQQTGWGIRMIKVSPIWHMAIQSAVAYALLLRHCRPCALFGTKNSSAINAEMNGFSDNHFRLMAKLDLFIYSFTPQTSTKHLP